MAKQELDLLQLATTFVALSSARPTEVVRCHIGKITGLARLLYNAPDNLGLNPSGAIRPALLIARKIGPSMIFASVIQARSGRPFRPRLAQCLNGSLQLDNLGAPDSPAICVSTHSVRS